MKTSKKIEKFNYYLEKLDTQSFAGVAYLLGVSLFEDDEKGHIITKEGSKAYDEMVSSFILLPRSKRQWLLKLMKEAGIADAGTEDNE